MAEKKVCSHCGVEKDFGQFKRLKGYGKGTRDRQCRDCYKDRLESKITRETSDVLKEYGYKVSRTTNKSSIEKLTKAMLTEFGGAEKFAQEYYALYERVKYQRTDSDSSPAAYMVIAVLHLCDAAGHIQEKALQTDAYHKEHFVVE